MSRRVAVFLPIPGTRHEGVDVVGGHRPAQGGRRVDRQQGQGDRRADPVGADEGLEAHPLVPAWGSRRG